MSHGIFFNMFRNGDLFVVREFVRSMIHQIPQLNWYYAHGNHKDSLKDLPCQYIPMPHFYEVCDSVGCKHHDVSELIPKYKPLNPGEPVRFLSSNSPLYINTWAGCWHGTKFPLGCYPNMHDLLSIWKSTSEIVNQKTGYNVQFNDDIVDYFPSIDYDMFDKSLVENANSLMSQFDRRILFANGRSMSGQSRLDVHVLNTVITQLSQKFPRIAFVVTDDFGLTQDNVFSTNRLFEKHFDLPEISYLSTFCDVIVGKNSGPFTYAHVKSNVMNKDKTFVSFSNLMRDNLLYDISNVRCRFIHSSALDSDDVAKILYDIL